LARPATFALRVIALPRIPDKFALAQKILSVT
jgi:hypothetical protein